MKVGDYVRLDRCQGINKIDEEDEIGTFYLEDVIGDEWGDETFRLDTNDVIKSSPNIIDLIEVGDYVNGSKIIELATNIDGKVLYLETDITEFDNVYACGHINIYEKDIKSIVTSEQFSQMEYRIGE